ncbi:DUF5343 domain-containing protein [Hyphomonas johnsonii]|uniref:Uncharacterized protein n=1 Tax=Hyphomonas johnsonii MHS-2 TaxID=1280950 RepID=A0A059FR89_9PROT|nr:DUF5343 domain-containing protein [Hyphomonas johnsonii]KCZ92973.1 hypothetical protein HJO_08457 [Hyphomonas johnsonii MHS-2]
MADEKIRYPQIPSKVWWSLREKIKKSPNSPISETFISVELGVQTTAAKAYLSEIKAVGLIDDEGRPTERGKNWRLDDEHYTQAVEQMLSDAYPAELIDIAPPGENDRAKAVSWFETAAGLGQGAAGNKAATYFLIGTPVPPNEPPTTKPSNGAAKKKVPPKATKDAATTPNDVSVDGPKIDVVPINVNVQIHISADATGEQIEAIFLNMKKYLR